jgi:PhoPQ-activated pathogenicity-related protein
MMGHAGSGLICMLHRFHGVLRRVALCTALACGVAGTPSWSADDGGSGALAEYLARPDGSFEWREATTGRIGSTTYVELLVTSQTWRGLPWKHQLFLLRPGNMSGETRQALLFIHGGRWKEKYEAVRTHAELPREARYFARLAETLRAPVGVVRQVPHQPLFERREDALIAYTFDRYLETGERDWPLLLPMVKSAVRAMDTMQEVARQRWGVSIDSFTVAGASKRGWTSWLTAAVDPRVMAVAPMVIDVLNMQAQLEHQRMTWGDVSEEIRDYSDLGIPSRLGSDQGRELLSIVDPYSYRGRLAKPKLILLSTNDRYWPLDALKLYWDGLPEPKHVLYVPNQGHGLRDMDRVIGALSALHRHAARGDPLPQLSWRVAPASHELALEVKADRPPRRVVMWSAHSPSRDFREAHWVSRRCTRSRDAYVCDAARATQGYTAVFAEASFKDTREVAFSLSTTVCMAGPPSATPSPEC